MNKNYAHIIKAGFGIEIRSQDQGISRIYLTRGGIRTGDWTNFTGGYFNAAVLQQKAIHTRKGTHLDRALNYLSQNKEVSRALRIIEENEKLSTTLPTARTKHQATIKI